MVIPCTKTEKVTNLPTFMIPASFQWGGVRALSPASSNFPAISLAAHWALHSVLCQSLLKYMAVILAGYWLVAVNGCIFLL